MSAGLTTFEIELLSPRRGDDLAEEVERVMAQLELLAFRFEDAICTGTTGEVHLWFGLPRLPEEALLEQIARGACLIRTAIDAAGAEPGWFTERSVRVSEHAAA